MTASSPNPRPDVDVAPVVSAGMVVVDHISTPIDHAPVPGELVPAEALVLNIGGGSANTSIGLARLGIRARIRARIGDDAFGRFAVEALDRAGVDTRSIAIDSSRATSQTLIINVRGEDRRFVHSVGANSGFEAADLDSVLDPSPRVLHIGYFLILERLNGVDLAARFARARAGGTFTVLDVATPGPGRYLEPLRAVLPETDLFVPNTDEAALILGERDPVRQAEAFRALGARRVVITCGNRGAVALSDGLRVRLGTYPVPFVDATGGGDAFDAGYIAGHIDGLDELGCLKIASAFGASCVRAVGTTAGLFSRPEADAFIAAHSLAVEPIPA